MSNRKKHNEKYYHKNKKKLLKHMKEYYMENKDKRIKYAKKWQEDNLEYFKDCKRRYNKTEDGRATTQRGNSKRRVKIKNIINTLTFQEWLNVLKEFKYKCAYCGKEFDLFDLPTRDHIIPLSKGGDNTKENVVPACKSCNSKKSNKIIGGKNNEWREHFQAKVYKN